MTKRPDPWWFALQLICYIAAAVLPLFGRSYAKEVELQMPGQYMGQIRAEHGLAIAVTVFAAVCAILVLFRFLFPHLLWNRELSMALIWLTFFPIGFLIACFVLVVSIDTEYQYEGTPPQYTPEQEDERNAALSSRTPLFLCSIFVPMAVFVFMFLFNSIAACVWKKKYREKLHASFTPAPSDVPLDERVSETPKI